MPGLENDDATQHDSVDDVQDHLPTPQRFFAIVYSCAFLLALGNGFLSGKTSFIAVDWFADAKCAGVDTERCDVENTTSCRCKDAFTTYVLVSLATTFSSYAFAMFVVPFLTRASDAFGRRIFIQVSFNHGTWRLQFLSMQLIAHSTI